MPSTVNGVGTHYYGKGTIAGRGVDPDLTTCAHANLVVPKDSLLMKALYRRSETDGVGDPAATTAAMGVADGVAAVLEWSARSR